MDRTRESVRHLGCVRPPPRLWLVGFPPRSTAVGGRRLAQRELHSLVMAGPWAEESSSAEALQTRDAWRRLARYLHQPYVFDPPEWEGLRDRAAAAAPPVPHSQARGCSTATIIQQLVRDEIGRMMTSRIAGANDRE